MTLFYFEDKISFGFGKLDGAISVGILLRACASVHVCAREIKCKLTYMHGTVINTLDCIHNTYTMCSILFSAINIRNTCTYASNEYKPLTDVIVTKNGDTK